MTFRECFSSEAEQSSPGNPLLAPPGVAETATAKKSAGVVAGAANDRELMPRAIFRKTSHGRRPLEVQVVSDGEDDIKAAGHAGGQMLLAASLVNRVEEPLIRADDRRSAVFYFWDLIFLESSFSST